jgi:geranylgeranyl diphosphate synthase type I
VSDIKAILNKYSAPVDNTIKAMLAETPEFMRGVINYHFGWVDQSFAPANFDRGKMFRPTMSLLVFEALTGEYRTALPVAASIEMIHNFSLLHDDIEDNDVERRGRPTAWKIWGKPLIINVGDYLYSLAYKALYQLDANQFAPESLFTVFRLINETCLALTQGQDLDLRFETLETVSTEMYVDMVYKKTGALVEAAILSGAILGTSDKAILDNYYQFARNIGIAFQIQDDILGIWGDSDQTGKSSDNDLYRKKKTLPIIYMLEKAEGSRRAELQTLYTRSESLLPEEVAFIRDSLAWTEARPYTQAIAEAYREKAFRALQALNLQYQAHTELEQLAKFLIDRTY